VTPRPVPAPGDDEAPPRPFGWGGLYALVLVALAAAIVALAWLTERWR
jgi:hypothetical protein